MFALLMATNVAKSQIPGISPELKELIELSVNKGHKVTERHLDKEITLSQRQGVRMTYVPKLEVGGKYLYAPVLREFPNFRNLWPILPSRPCFPVWQA